MGKIIKSFTATTATGKIRREGKIDTGADRTIIPFRDACLLGLDTTAAPIRAMGTATGRMSGFLIPARVQIGKRVGTVQIFVPVFDDRGAPISRKHSLVGHDFLQATKAMLDYSKPHEQVLSGFEKLPNERVTAKERARLRALPCPLPKRRRKTR